ncbi:MAG: GNAT family N-acetyltransferase [Piscinibacter sp.]|nr:GNAT family N-acetyltransferase [Piscinibacter sp.]
MPPLPDVCHIRRAQPGDAAALAAFAARTFEETFGADNRPEDMQAHLAASYGEAQQSRELADPQVATLLACRGEVLVGYAQVRCRPPPASVAQADCIELHRFYVDRPAQGRGVAGELMAAVRDAARAFGARFLWLSVWERNPRAIAFYAKQGFVDRGSTVFWVGPDRQTDRVLVGPVPPATA